MSLKMALKFLLFCNFCHRKSDFSKLLQIASVWGLFHGFWAPEIALRKGNLGQVGVMPRYVVGPGQVWFGCGHTVAIGFCIGIFQNVIAIHVIAIRGKRVL